MAKTTSRRRSRRPQVIPPVAVTEEMAAEIAEVETAPAETAPAPVREARGKRLDVNSKLARLFRDGGWTKVEHVSDHATFERDDATVTARLQARWTLRRADGTVAEGTGAVALEAALAGQ